MPKKVSKKIIEEAIQAAIGKNVITEIEIPIPGTELIPSIGAGIAGAARDVAGNYRVNRAKSYMNQFSKKTDDNWKRLKDKAKKHAYKLSQSKNPNVAATGNHIQNELEDTQNRIQAVIQDINQSFPTAVMGATKIEKKPRGVAEKEPQLPSPSFGGVNWEEIGLNPLQLTDKQLAAVVRVQQLLQKQGRGSLGDLSPKAKESLKDKVEQAAGQKATKSEKEMASQVKSGIEYGPGFGPKIKPQVQPQPQPQVQPQPQPQPQVQPQPQPQPQVQSTAREISPEKYVAGGGPDIMMPTTIDVPMPPEKISTEPEQLPAASSDPTAAGMIAQPEPVPLVKKKPVKKQIKPTQIKPVGTIKPTQIKAVGKENEQPIMSMADFMARSGDDPEQAKKAKEKIDQERELFKKPKKKRKRGKNKKFVIVDRDAVARKEDNFLPTDERKTKES